jgi:hypothetical protein
MTTSRRPPLELEVLGPRILPSTTLPAVPAPAPAPAILSTAVHILDGTGTGVYSTNRTLPDVGTTYHFNGSANLAGMGAVTVTGSITTVGFMVQGQAHGTLTFANARGSVTVEVLGPSQPGFSALPGHFEFKVISHTGAFSHLWASGTLSLALHPFPTADLLGGRGTFTLTVGAPHPPGSL